MKANKRRNSLLLFLTAAIWGMSFVSQSKGMEYMDPFTFNGVRSFIGALSLFIYILVTGRLSVQRRQQIPWKLTLQAGMSCGLLLGIASMFQQYGIKYTTVGKTGFITTLYIIFVPIAGIFFRKKVAAIVWVAAGIAAVGMYLLCMTESFTIGKGDLLVFVCALFFTAHIMVIDFYTAKTDGVLVSCIQFLVAGVLCSTGAFIWGQPTLEQITNGMGTLLYAGVLSCGVAYTLQIVGQKGLNPTVAALILSLESVVATVAGWIAFEIGFLTEDQSLTSRQIIGCIIVFSAVVLVQLPKEWLPGGRNKNRKMLPEQNSQSESAS